MSRAEEYLKQPYYIEPPSLNKIDLDDTFNRFEVIQLMEDYHKSEFESRVNAISDVSKIKEFKYYDAFEIWINKLLKQ